MDETPRFQHEHQIPALDSDPRHEHNNAPRVITVRQSPALRRAAARSAEISHMVDHMSLTSGVPGPSPATEFGQDDGLRPQSPRQYPKTQSGLDHGTHAAPAGDARVGELERRVDRMEDLLVEIHKEITAPKATTPKKSRSKKPKESAPAGGDAA